MKHENGGICLLVIEWKYTECYEYGLALAVTKRGTQRIERYRVLLEHADSPISPGEDERLFFDPFDQLMRLTLLAWQMVENREFGATEWLHLNVVPFANRELLGVVTVTSTGEIFYDMESAWSSPDRASTSSQPESPTA